MQLKARRQPRQGLAIAVPASHWLPDHLSTCLPRRAPQNLTSAPPTGACSPGAHPSRTQPALADAAAWAIWGVRPCRPLELTRTLCARSC
jgi:hypothetical protein